MFIVLDVSSSHCVDFDYLALISGGVSMLGVLAPAGGVPD